MAKWSFAYGDASLTRKAWARSLWNWAKEARDEEVMNRFSSLPLKATKTGCEKCDQVLRKEHKDELATAREKQELLYFP